jgi:hypothetical protein
VAFAPNVYLTRERSAASEKTVKCQPIGGELGPLDWAGVSSACASCDQFPSGVFDISSNPPAGWSTFRPEVFLSLLIEDQAMRDAINRREHPTDRLA